MSASDSPLIFDRLVLRQRQARARANFSAHSALFDDTAAQVHERIGDVRRPFKTALDLSSFPCLDHPNKVSHGDVVFDEEYLPFAPASFDLIVSNLSMHWINDVPGVLTQIRGLLKNEGMFLATLIGEGSLSELRLCLLDAELALSGGISPRTSPTIDTLTASQLMQRAGFTLPVADKETVTLVYADMFALMKDLRGTGQTNVQRERRSTLTGRTLFLEAARLYKDRYGDKNGHIPATFDVIYLHGWK